MTDIMDVGGALQGLAIGMNSAMTFSRCDLLVTVAWCLSGASLGLAVGMVVSWLVPEMVMRSWEAQLGDPTIRLPAPLNDARSVGALIFYGIPLVFVSVGVGTAYYLCMAGAL